VVREVQESLIIKYQTRRWDMSRSTAKAAAPANKPPVQSAQRTPLDEHAAACRRWRASL
jgi:hypothetical protein